jgi:hypothetical protein
MDGLGGTLEERRWSVAKKPHHDTVCMPNSVISAGRRAVTRRYDGALSRLRESPSSLMKNNIGVNIVSVFG